MWEFVERGFDIVLLLLNDEEGSPFWMPPLTMEACKIQSFFSNSRLRGNLNTNGHLTGEEFLKYGASPCEV